MIQGGELRFSAFFVGELWGRVASLYIGHLRCLLDSRLRGNDGEVGNVFLFTVYCSGTIPGIAPLVALIRPGLG